MIFVLIAISLLVGILGTSIYISPKNENTDSTIEELIVEEIKIDFSLYINWKSFFTAFVTLIPIMVIHLEYGIVASLILSVMILISVWDLRFKLVPNTPIYLLAVLSALELTVMEPTHEQLFGNIFLACGVLFLLLIIAVATQGKIGGVDIKIFSILALTLGLDHLFLTFYLTFLIGGLIVVPIYLVKRIKMFALVPYITIAYFITKMYGENIVWWYTTGGIHRLF